MIQKVIHRDSRSSMRYKDVSPPPSPRATDLGVDIMLQAESALVDNAAAREPAQQATHTAAKTPAGVLPNLSLSKPLATVCQILADFKDI